ncbi:response regulator [Paenibacillus sp. MBLB4367]|uniref:response regulator transcription factor n=1 Tax=Paenibacillus sp. MBLB4367 TaxID=3384767 RepID=UPI003908161A
MLRLLIVDDELWVRERFSERIDWESIGIRLIGAASDAEEAIQLMESERPHLLLTDITMPGMNGLELAAYVRERWPKVKIIILTAYGEFAFAQRAISIGVTDYLMKMAKSPEHILASVRLAAQELRKEIDVDWHQDWKERKRWAERVLGESGEAERTEYPPAVAELLLQKRSPSCAIVAYGWDVYRTFGGHAADDRSRQLQAEAGMAIESRLAQEMRDRAITGSEKHKAVVIPYKENRLFVIIGMSAHAAIQSELLSIAKAGLDLLRSIAGPHCFTHYGSGLTDSQQCTEQLRALRDGLSGYFYKDSPYITETGAASFQRVDPVTSRKWLADAVKSLEQGMIDPLRRAVADMTNKAEPSYYPPDLLRISQKLLDPALVVLPPAVAAKLGAIPYIERMEDFKEWWDEMLQHLNQAIGEQGLFKMRKEVQTMCRIIRERYTEDLQVTELAQHVLLHPSYAGQLFKQETGEHVSDYLNRIRIKKAEELLGHTTMKIYEVSQAVGISDYRYFCRLFKSVTGSTPTQYKKAAQ